MAGIGSRLFYAVLTFVSERVLTDTIYSLGHHDLLLLRADRVRVHLVLPPSCSSDFYSFVFKLLFPLLGGLGLGWVFVVTLRDSASPDYGSGAEIGGVGLVLILGPGPDPARHRAHAVQRARDPAPTSAARPWSRTPRRLVALGVEPV